MDDPRESKWLVSTALAASLIAGCMALAGCTSWPFPAQERTSIITPGMRAASIREIAARARNADADEQQRLCEQLADQIRTEPDPIVRQAIQATVAEFPTPLAREVLLAGLRDADLDVRLICCHQLSKRPEPATVRALRAVVESDDDLDVRLAAVDALGAIPSTESVAALATALKDRDTAMQYAAVQALKSASDQDFGNDVAAWRQYAEGKQPAVSVAEKSKRWSPF